MIARGAAGKGKRGNDLFKTLFVLPHRDRNLKENTKAVSLILDEAKKDGFRFMVLRPEGYHVASDLEAIAKIKRFFRELQPIPDGAEVVDCTGDKEAEEEVKESQEKEEQMIEVGAAKEAKESRPRNVDELGAPGDEKDNQMKEIDTVAKETQDGKVKEKKNVEESEVTNEIEKVSEEDEMRAIDNEDKVNDE